MQPRLEKWLIITKPHTKKSMTELKRSEKNAGFFIYIFNKYLALGSNVSGDIST